jgi:phosphoribosylanthranilate isomerase
MTWIKICGITDLEDALAAVDAGADALGFVFYEKSPRNVTAKDAGEIIDELPERVERVAVVVENFTSGVQLPGNITAVQWIHTAIPENIAAFVSHVTRPYKSFVSYPVADLDDKSLERLSSAFEQSAKCSERPSLTPAFDALFLDSGNVHMPGGTGKPFHWGKAVPIANQMRNGPFKLVVAGGLTPQNVGEAIRVLRPWGVDVSSGVEAKPGTKDPEKIRAFIRAVREVDKASSNN